jgi:hypothetical protein
LNRRIVERWLFSKKRRTGRYSSGTLRIPLKKAGIPAPPYCPEVLKKTEDQYVRFAAETSYDPPPEVVSRPGHRVDCEGLHEWTSGVIAASPWASNGAEVSEEYTALYLRRKAWETRWFLGRDAHEDDDYPEWLEDLQMLDYWGLGISGEVSEDQKYMYLTVSYKWDYPQRGRLIARRIHLAMEEAARRGVHIKLCRNRNPEYT